MKNFIKQKKGVKSEKVSTLYSKSGKEYPEINSTTFDKQDVVFFFI